MSIQHRWDLFYEGITNHRHFVPSLASIFILFLTYYFATWPIVMTDTDLWYHLAGGRHFFESDSIAHDAFFSYVTPSKTWYNYYWLFQATVYKMFQWADYYGLIVLRSILSILTAFFIYLSFIRRDNNRTEMLVGLFLTISCVLVIMPRELLTRPHLFSYLFIVVFLYILECKRDKIWILPLLGIFWSNVHGIEYPVMFLIVFAYLAEIYWKQIRKIPNGEEGRKTKWLLISVFYTVFITPGVIELIQTPFSAALYQHLYVAELLPLPFKNIFVFAPVSAKGVIASLQNLIVILTVVIYLFSLWKQKLRISHAILVLGAVLLLAQHARFTYEFTLLSIPLLYQGVRLFAAKDPFPGRVVSLAMPVVVILLPLFVFQSELGNRPAYPFSTSHLPSGVARFLKHQTPGGSILNEPNTGGYLPLALGDKFKIYMDMQMSLFSDVDFATVQNAFYNEDTFKAFIKKYDPDFISVSLNRQYFKKIVAADARFVPVFFDHAELLYINKDKYGDIARKFELKAIDPFHFREANYEGISGEALGLMFAEAARIRDEDPNNYSANHILASIAIVRKQYDQALSHAEVIITNFRELSHGYALKGDALLGMEQYAEAAPLYSKALEMGQTAKQEKIYWNLHAAYAKMKEYKKAYRVLSKYVNPFSLTADYKEIYQLAMSAATVGKFSESVTFLKIARLKVSPTDTEYVQKIEKNLVIQSGDSKE